MKWLIISTICTLLGLISIFTHHYYLPYKFYIALGFLIPAVISFLLWTRYVLTRVEIEWSQAPQGTTHYDPVTRRWERWVLMSVRRWNENKGHWEHAGQDAHRDFTRRIRRPEV